MTFEGEVGVCTPAMSPSPKQGKKSVVKSMPKKKAPAVKKREVKA
jgi:hypothetical protein